MKRLKRLATNDPYDAIYNKACEEKDEELLNTLCEFACKKWDIGDCISKADRIYFLGEQFGSDIGETIYNVLKYSSFDYRDALGEYVFKRGNAVFDENKVYKWFEEIAEENDEWIEYLSKRNKDTIKRFKSANKHEIVNYLCNDDFDDDNRIASMDKGWMVDYAEDTFDLIDEKATMERISNDYYIGTVDNAWFFKIPVFRKRDTYFFENDSDMIIKVLDEYLEKYPLEYDDSTTGTEDPMYDEEGRVNPWYLSEIDDKSGETTNLDRAVDISTREYPVVYVGHNGHGLLIIGNSPSDTHMGIFNKWCKEHPDTYDKDVPLEDWSRYNISQVLNEANIDSMAFGDVVDDCFLLDVDAKMEKCTPDEVMSAAKEIGYTKYYLYHSKSVKVTKAKLHRLRKRN